MMHVFVSVTVVTSVSGSTYVHLNTQGILVYRWINFASARGWEGISVEPSQRRMPRPEFPCWEWFLSRAWFTEGSLLAAPVVYTACWAIRLLLSSASCRWGLHLKRLTICRAVGLRELATAPRHLKTNLPCLRAQDRAAESVALKPPNGEAQICSDEFFRFLANEGQDVPQLRHRVRVCCWHSTCKTFSSSKFCISCLSGWIHFFFPSTSLWGFYSSNMHPSITMYTLTHTLFCIILFFFFFLQISLCKIHM